MANEKVTKRDVLTKIANGEMNEDIQNWAVAEIEKLNASNAKSRERAAKKAEENAPLIEDLKALLTSEAQPASYFAEATGLTPAKVSALFRKMKEADQVKVEKIKGKSGKVNGYSLPEVESESEEDWG